MKTKPLLRKFKRVTGNIQQCYTCIQKPIIYLALWIDWCKVVCVCVSVSSDGTQYSSVPDGMFRKPSKGQSLISYLSEQDFGSCADLEKVTT